MERYVFIQSMTNGFYKIAEYMSLETNARIVTVTTKDSAFIDVREFRGDNAGIDSEKRFAELCNVYDL